MTRKAKKRRVRRRSETAERVLGVLRNLLTALGIGIVVLAVISVRTDPFSLGLGEEGKSWLELLGSRPSAPRIAIIAGHWQFDSGAVCPDGLQEVDINLDVARRVVEVLRGSGYVAEVLPEYSRKLDGYRAVAMVSLHADSCVEHVSGFKVAARVGRVGQEEDNRLVECLHEAYGKATGLPRHDRTITVDMTQYHAFRVISPETPAAIIEMGFMGSDRELLTQQQDLVAQGIVEGILLFLETGEEDASSQE